MNKFKKYFALAAVVLSVSMLCSCGSVSSGEKLKIPALKSESITLTPNNKQVSVLPTQEGISEDTDDYEILKYEEIARNSNSILYADMASGHFALQDIESEAIWYDIPNNTELDEITSGTERMEVRSQLLIRYILRIEESTTSSYKIETSQSLVKKGNLTTEKIDNGFKVTYKGIKSGITVPVRYYLTEDSFRAEIILDELDEGKDSFLLGIDLLPVFGAGDTDDEGYAFVPDGSGAIVDFGYHKDMQVPYERAVYGEEKAIRQVSKKFTDEPVMLPVFGICKGDSSLLGIITDGDASSSITMFYHSDSYGYTAPSAILDYRVMDTKAMFEGQGGLQTYINRISALHTASKAFAVEYSVLNGEDNGYVGMAKKYREYLKENGVLDGKVSAPTFNLEVYGAADLTTSFLGFDYSTTEILTTISQTEKIISALEKAGIGEMSVRYKGFGGDGILNRKLNTSVSPLRKIGSVKQMAALGKDVQLYPDFDLSQIRESGGGAALSGDTAYTLFDYKAPQFSYSLASGVKLSEDDIYLLNGRAILGATDTILDGYKKSGYNNVSVSSIGSMLYSDLNTKTGMYRDEAVLYTKKAFEKFSKACKSVSADSANAYALGYVDKVWNAPVYSSAYDIFDRDVPFYQIVLHGSITTTSSGIIQASEPAVELLKAVETGSELMFGCTYEESTVLIGSRYEYLYSTAFDNWKDYAVEINSRYSDILKQIYDKEITDHTEAASGVFVTEFGDVSVAVNYNDTEAEVNGTVIEPLGFALLNGGAEND